MLEQPEIKASDIIRIINCVDEPGVSRLYIVSDVEEEGGAYTYGLIPDPDNPPRSQDSLPRL